MNLTKKVKTWELLVQSARSMGKPEYTYDVVIHGNHLLTLQEDALIKYDLKMKNGWRKVQKVSDRKSL